MGIDSVVRKEMYSCDICAVRGLTAVFLFFDTIHDVPLSPRQHDGVAKHRWCDKRLDITHLDRRSPIDSESKL